MSSGFFGATSNNSMPFLRSGMAAASGSVTSDCCHANEKPLVHRILENGYALAMIAGWHSNV